MKKLSLTLLAILATTSFAGVVEPATPAKASILEQAADNHPGADVVRKKKKKRTKKARKGRKHRAAPQQEEQQFDAPLPPTGQPGVPGGQGGFQPQGGPQNPPIQGIPDSVPRPNNPNLPSPPPPPSM